MKRLLPLLLVLLLLLTACSGDKSPTGTTAPVPATSAAGSTEPEAPATTEASFTPILLLENEVCALTLTDLSLDDVWGYSFSFLCENRSEVTELFQMPEISCQGWMLTTDWMQSVDAGQTQESKFNIWLSDLARCGLESLDELDMRLTVKNYDSYSLEPLADERLSLSPASLVKELIEPAPAQIAGPEQLIAENDLFKFTIRGRDEDNIWTYNLNLCIENKSDQDLIFSWRDCKVNGVQSTAWLYYTVPAGLRTCFNLYFPEDEMKEKNIDAIQTVDFTLHVTPADSFTALYSEAHSYTVP